MQKCKKRKNDFLIKLMRISMLQIIAIIMFSGIAFANPDYAQILNKRLSVNLKNVTLKEALNDITNKIDVKFVYSSTMIPLNNKVSVSASGEKLGIILNTLLIQLNINYTVNDISGSIILKKDDKPISDNAVPNKTITGKVTSKTDGSPLPGVSIKIKDVNKGTVTDADGKYSISVPGDGSVLVFTYIGYQKLEITVGSATVVNAQLVDDSKALNEVVVTAAGIKREKNALGYSVTTVTADKLAQKSEPDPLRALTGKVAGVNVQSSGGVAGGATNITIRGNSSLNGNNQPLFVVDGIPFDNSSFTNVGATSVGASGVTNRAYDLDPNNIESMTVLKGAAAAALYGSRAANGAIIITTKSGKKQSRKGTEITYSTSYAFENVSGLPDYQTSYGQGTNNDYRQGVYASWGQPFPGVTSIIPTRSTIPMQLTRTFGSNVFPQFYQADGITPIQVPYQSYAKENVKNFFQTGSLYENAVSISSGSEKGNFTAGISRSTNTGVVPSNNINRTSVNVGGNIKLENKFYASGSINYVTTNQQSPPIGGSTGSIMSALMYTPTSYDLTHYPYENPIDGSNVYDYTGVDNPYWSVKHSVSTSNVDRYYGNLVLGFDPLPWLNIQNSAGFNAYTDRRINVRGKGSSSYSNGSITTDNIYRQELDNTLLVTATKALSSDLSLKWIVGNNINQRVTDRQAFYGDGMIVADLNTITNTSSVTPIQLANNRNYIKQRFYAFFTDITFDYKTYASLNLVGRNDISSTLPVNNRSYYYGGANGSFIFSKAFKIPTNILNFGKVRGGYTRVGNEASAYQTAEFYLINSPLGASSGSGSIGTPYTPAGGSTYNTVTLANLLTNDNLKPEFITELELGTELQFFNNRIGIDFTYYSKKSTSQIFEVTAAPSSGFTTQILNLGEATNKGIEIGLNLAPIRTNGGFNWDISSVFTRNRNIINNLGGYQQFVYGGPNGTSSVHMVGQPYGLIYGTGYARDAAGNILIDPNTGKPLVSGSLKPIGNPNPDFVLGITNNFNYKNFSLSILFDWKKGGSLYSNTVGQMLARGVTKDTQNREFQIVSPGVLGNASTLKPLLDANGKEIPNNVGISYEDYFFSGGLGPGGVDEGSVFDATVFRLREISFSYQVPKNVLKRTPFGAASISVSGRNLWYYAPNFPKYTNFDPEVSSLGVGNSQGYDNLAVPTTKRFGINLKVSF
ncbi:MAG: TonB-dependent receptor plug [Mucilaginibacter sp.]|nr:TonB-dependent receptor plug [Mucilaginibacter sp.]